MRCPVASLAFMTPEPRSIIMRKRLKTITGATAALAALALGGSAIATAAQDSAGAKTHAAANTTREKTTGPDTDRIQSGDQTAPDVRGKASSTSPTDTSASETSTAEAPETSAESTESSAASDGPGGHEDPAGVDSQTQE
jgi:hypothetical protein